MKKLLFLSRGKGWGHSIRDIEIVKYLSHTNEYEVLFASYGAGYEAYRTKGIPCYDLQCREGDYGGPLIESFISLIKKLSPTWIVSDEELFMLPISHGFGIPCAYITNYFEPKDFIEKTCINYSDLILFAEYDNLCSDDHVNPSMLHYVGPIYQKVERIKKSKESNIVLVMLGGSKNRWSVIANVALIKKLISANVSDVRYRVVGDEISNILNEMNIPTENIEWSRRDKDLNKVLEGCGAAIIRGGINSLWEMASIGMPTLCVPYPKEVNPMEARYAEMMQERGLSSFIFQSDITHETLYKQLTLLLSPLKSEEIKRNFAQFSGKNGAAEAADCITKWLHTV